MVIHRISKDEAEQRSFYRMLHNSHLSQEEVIEYVVSDCLRQVESGRDYVIFQDTTQPNFERNRKNIEPHSGLGVIGDNKSLGFFAHPSLVMESGSGHMIGYSDVHCWIRQPKGTADRKTSCKSRDYRREPIEDKESYRWLDSARKSVKRLRAKGATGNITVVSDQEGDVYEVFQEDMGENAWVLARSKGDRKVIVPGRQAPVYIKEYLNENPATGYYELDMRGDARKNRKARKAKIALRFDKVCLLAPLRIRNKTKNIELYAVYARELPDSVPHEEKPIEWLLLTNRPIESQADAAALIQDYALRWNIEQVFRLIKQQGLDIEYSDLEQGQSIIKLFLLSLLACYQVAGLHQASKMETPALLKKMFTEQEKACLSAVCTDYEGKTQKQKNPYPKDTMQWAYWIVARLGGWKPNEKQAGVIALHRGWLKFQQLFEGWSLALSVS